MAWDDLVKTTNQVKTKARIYSNTYLDQRFSRDKRPLEIKDSGQDKQQAPKNNAIF